MKSTGIFLAGALVGAGALAVTAHLFRQSQPTETRADASELNLTSALRQDDDIAVEAPIVTLSSPPRAGGERELSEPQFGDEWNVFVEGMLESEVARRTDEKLTPEKKRRLISELTRLREASLALQQAPAEPDDPEAVRDRLTRTLALVQVDQAFRRELGLGVSEFLQGLQPDAVENVAPAPAER